MKTGEPVNIKAYCINAKGIPNEIPLSKHLKKDEQYTIIEFCKTATGMGVRLAEIDLSDCVPYQFYSLNRFGIPVDVQEVVEEEEEIEELV